MDGVRTTQQQLPTHPLGEATSALKLVKKRCRGVLIFAGRITTCGKLADYFDKQRQHFFPAFEHTFNC